MYYTEPFTTEEQAKQFLGLTIQHKAENGTLVDMKVFQVYRLPNHSLMIECVDNFGGSITQTAMNWFITGRYLGKPFGTPILMDKGE